VHSSNTFIMPEDEKYDVLEKIGAHMNPSFAEDWVY